MVSKEEVIFFKLSPVSGVAAELLRFIAKLISPAGSPFSVKRGNHESCIGDCASTRIAHILALTSAARPELLMAVSMSLHSCSTLPDICENFMFMSSWGVGSSAFPNRTLAFLCVDILDVLNRYTVRLPSEVVKRNSALKFSVVFLIPFDFTFLSPSWNFTIYR